MSIVNNFIDKLINQHEVLPDALFIENSAIISKYFHHSIKNIHDIGRRDIMLCGGNKIYTKFLGIKETDSLHILKI